jgi:hypothetical protein
MERLTDSCGTIFSSREKAQVGQGRPMTESQPRRLRFHIVIDREARQIAKRLKDVTQLRVFLVLPSFLRWEAWHQIDEERIAAELEITPDELRKALAALVLHGLILHDDTRYHIPVWRLSSVWGAKGSWREVQANIAGEAD